MGIYLRGRIGSMDNNVGPDLGANPNDSTILNEHEIDDFVDDSIKLVTDKFPEHIMKILGDGRKLELLQDLRRAIETVIRDHFSATPA